MSREAVRKLRGIVAGTSRTMAGTLREERGVILIAVILAVAVLLVMVVSVSSLASGETRATPFWRDRDEAFYVSESGLNHCMWKMKYERDEITPREGVYPDDPPTFTSTSEDDTTVVIDGTPQNVLPAGSSYEVWVKTDPVDTTVAHVTVVGHVNGQSYLLKATLKQEDPPFEPNPDGTERYDEEEKTMNLPPDNDGIDYIHVTNEDVILPGGTYVVNWVRCDGHGNLIFTSDATVWVRESIFCQGNGVVNPGGAKDVPPEERITLIFYMPPLDGLNVTISGTTEFNAFIFAPTARIKVLGNASVYGDLVGESLKVQGSTQYNPDGANIGFPETVQTDYEAVIWGE